MCALRTNTHICTIHTFTQFWYSFQRYFHRHFVCVSAHSVVLIVSLCWFWTAIISFLSHLWTLFLSLSLRCSLHLECDEIIMLRRKKRHETSNAWKTHNFQIYSHYTSVRLKCSSVNKYARFQCIDCDLRRRHCQVRQLHMSIRSASGWCYVHATDGTAIDAISLWHFC